MAEDLQIRIGVSLDGVEASGATAISSRRVGRSSIGIGDGHVGGSQPESAFEHRLDHLAKHQMKHVFKAVAFTQMTEFLTDILPNSDSNAVNALSKIGTGLVTGLLFGGPSGAVTGGIIAGIQVLHGLIERNRQAQEQIEAKIKENDKRLESFQKVIDSALAEIEFKQGRLVTEETNKRYLELRTVL